MKDLDKQEKYGLKQMRKDYFEVADSLFHYGAMLPTRVVYEANRDIIRAQSLPWHKKYTHQLLIERNGPDPNIMEHITMIGLVMMNTIGLKLLIFGGI